RTPKYRGSRPHTSARPISLVPGSMPRMVLCLMRGGPDQGRRGGSLCERLPAAYGAVPVVRDEVGYLLPDALETIEADRGRERRAGATELGLDRGHQVAVRQAIRMQDVHEAALLQTLGPDQLLGPRCHSRDHHGATAEREDLGHRVVATHGHHEVRRGDQR